MAFDSSKPANGSAVLSAELCHQFTGLQSNIQAKASEDDCSGRLARCAVNPTAVGGLGQAMSDPPTQAEVQALSNKLDELSAVLKRS